MAQTTTEDALRDRARDYRIAGEKAHAEKRYRLRNRMFKLHDNIMLRILQMPRGNYGGPIRRKRANSKR